MLKFLGICFIILIILEIIWLSIRNKVYEWLRKYID